MCPCKFQLGICCVNHGYSFGRFQDSVPKSVCLVYDPVRTLSGSVHLKAYRLSDRFMAKYRDHQEKQAADKNQHGFTEASALVEGRGWVK